MGDKRNHDVNCFQAEKWNQLSKAGIAEGDIKYGRAPVSKPISCSGKL